MPEQALQKNPANILIVDDDPAQRLLLQAALMQTGLMVREAVNGLEALGMFQQFLPELILMDIKMPVMDGLEACSRIRKLPDGKDVPIVLITGLDDHESIKQAFNAGATDFITKPVNWPILNHRVRYLLRASRAFHALRQSEIRLSDAQRIAELGNWEWDKVNDKLYWSDQIYHIFGLQPQAFEPTYDAFLSRIHPDDLDSVTTAINRALINKEPYYIDHRIILPDGSERIVIEQAEVVLSKKGVPVSMHGTVQDITQRKQDEKKIQNLAFYDVLTGLPNRKNFKQHARRALSLAADSMTKVALLFLDLDEFKRVNDTLGHDIGDELLKSISRNLSQCLRVTDSISELDPKKASQNMLSRLGGDEFIILLDGFVKGEQVGRVARRVLDKLHQKVVVDGQEFFMTASMGIAVYPDDGTEVDTLLKHADIAMYQAKKNSKNSFQFYSNSLNKHSRERLGLEAKLRRALEREELKLHYQPQVSTVSGKVIGMEALIRWYEPDAGIISPAQFIPIAEESGLILPIGDWVMQTACEQTKAWQQAGLNSIKMSVNLSSHQFRQPDFMRTVRNILDSAHLDAEYLELEMTESIIMHQVDETIKELNDLKQLGLTLSIDDFGTGYSSMSYLKYFPLDTLKIDRSFVKNVAIDSSDAAITKAVIMLAKSLGLSTVAEGVEKETQLNCLTKLGCDTIQGYYFSRPLAATEAYKYLLKNASESQDLQALNQGC